MGDKKTVEMKLVTYLPNDPSSISNFDSNGVLSFHFYDPMAVASSFVAIPESIYTYRNNFLKCLGSYTMRLSKEDLFLSNRIWSVSRRRTSQRVSEPTI